MQQVFVEKNAISDHEIRITGDDVKHMKHVLRMRAGERIRVSSGDDNYFCSIQSMEADQIIVRIEENAPATELPNSIYLFQAIPKGDRMETVIEKAVELGVHEIIPVEMKYCVVKLDEKKKKNRQKRYQAIAESAAKQSKRSYIPVVKEVMSYQEAISYAKSCDISLLPYENKEGMAETIKALAKIKAGMSVSIMIGPEGGFAPEEIAQVENEMEIISLGTRILRTDTAAICAMSAVMLCCEKEGI